MKVFKNRVLAVLMMMCMLLSLLPISALAAENDCDLTIDVGGTGVTWYAADKAGAEIGDGSYAVPAAEIEVNEDGDVPAITVTTTLYVKADPGYKITDLDEFLVKANGDSEEKEKDTSLAVEISQEGLEYCDLKVTLKFDRYAVEGKSASISLEIDAEPTYLTITVGGTSLDILDTNNFSTLSYADAEAIPYGVAYNAAGTTVAVVANVADPKNGVMVGLVVDGEPVFDEESHTGVSAFVDVTSENTIDNPVYVAVRYIPNKEGVTEAKPYDEFFKIAIYMITSSFTDVSPSDYFYNAVAWAVEKDVTKGTGDGATFSPYDDCTRAQFATFLYRAAGSPAVTGTKNPFSDVSETGQASYYDAILWAVDQGVTTGTGDGTTFSPDETITRAQAVTFMYRYAQKNGIATGTGAANFGDVANEGALASYYDAIGWAVANGITNGTGDGTTFSPMDDCDRGMMITFLHRLFTDATA